MLLLSQAVLSCRLACISSLNLTLGVGRRCYAKTILGALTGKAKALGAVVERKKPLPVEEDPNRLVNYCCGSNIYKEGEDAKIKEDSEYPDWLWTLRTGPPPPIEEMDPNTKEYWEHFFFLHRIRSLRMKRIKQKKKLRVNEEDKMFKLKQLRFRALAYKYGAGYDTPPKFDKAGWKIIS